MDLLYDEKMYGELLRLYDDIRKRIQANNQYIPAAICAIVFASYYRLVSKHGCQLPWSAYLRITLNLWKFYWKFFFGL